MADPDLDPLVQLRKDLTPPDGRDFWMKPQEYGKAPVFTTSQVASIFFGKTKTWLQMLLVNKENSLDGEIIEIPRGKRTDSRTFRQFQLYHVELIAHGLLSRGIIDLDRFTNCITIIKSIARNYRLL